MFIFLIVIVMLFVIQLSIAISKCFISSLQSSVSNHRQARLPYSSARSRRKSRLADCLPDCPYEYEHEPSVCHTLEFFRGCVPSPRKLGAQTLHRDSARPTHRTRARAPIAFFCFWEFCWCGLDCVLPLSRW